ncbi:hypothetical protein [Oerskovia paurometabola]|uniref:hypothetical protein n=1 Tax=Oerskovia paurometabola TaxID=162170 RepID=UPI00381E8F7C
MSQFNQDCAVDGCNRSTGDMAYVCPECGDALLALLRSVPDIRGERSRVLCYPHLPHHERCDGCGTPDHPRLNPLRETGERPVSPGLATDLDDAIARQSTGIGIVPADPEHELPDESGLVRLPYGYRASEARWELLSTMTATGDDIARRRGLFRPLNTLDALANWLTHQVQWLRQQPDGADTIAALTDLLRAARRVIDRPADRKYAGPCTATTVDEHGLATDCAGELYALHGRATVTCPDCGTDYPLDARRAWLRDQADDMLLPATELARAIDGLGIQVKAATLRKWASRKRILNRGTDTHPLYRVGDVIDLVTGGTAAAS